MCQDAFRLHGTKTGRYLLLFEKALLITKRRSDGTFSWKATVMVMKTPAVCITHLIHINDTSYYSSRSCNCSGKLSSFSLTLKQRTLDHG